MISEEFIERLILNFLDLGLNTDHFIGVYLTQDEYEIIFDKWKEKQAELIRLREEEDRKMLEEEFENN